MTDRRGECDEPAAASGLLHTLRAGGLDAPILAPAEPRGAQLRFAAAPGLDLRDRFRAALIGGAMPLEEAQRKISTDWYKVYQEMKGNTS